MKERSTIATLFVVAGVYDGLLGILFLVMAPRLYELCGVTPPNHYGYVHFPAALLIVFGIMFLAIARHPHKNRNLIPYGMLLKVCYCGVAAYHWVVGGIPFMWKPFAVMDAAFLLLFVWAYRRLRQ